MLSARTALTEEVMLQEWKAGYTNDRVRGKKGDKDEYTGCRLYDVLIQGVMLEPSRVSFEQTTCETITPSFASSAISRAKLSQLPHDNRQLQHPNFVKQPPLLILLQLLIPKPLRPLHQEEATATRFSQAIPYRDPALTGPRNSNPLPQRPQFPPLRYLLPETLSPMEESRLRRRHLFDAKIHVEEGNRRHDDVREEVNGAQCDAGRQLFAVYGVAEVEMELPNFGARSGRHSCQETVAG